ncbi:chymotrypsin inhibitor 3-like [Vigna unguiculata]|uniref:Kunitz inhibitor ST1-like n=1 Tax=Vigna unguiculata TaxID=3917 RepID=A0A4D6M695_VIGUN|nr:chymotrypsin inhibitor 3-like [Vigna unguiculata]QCD95686.1 Kunitz inhibitor ST1-like [Vigna unguiculata]QCE11274.1 Kunitz inhibitor ST1-like [Vigna unguiculata]
MASATLFALFLFSALTFYPPSTTAQPVTDGDGNIVKNGGIFYILPSGLGAPGGGIRALQTDNESIPLSVVQSPFKGDNGLPIIISSPIRTEFLPEGQVTLSFEHTNREWSVVEGLPEGTLVKVQGYPHTVSGSFFIKKAKAETNTYKLLFCEEGVFCGNVRVVRNGNWVLAVTQDEPYEFYLKRVPPTSADA